jgi:hypothetical protein
LPHPFTAEWTAHLQIDEPGRYTFEIATSGLTVVSFDQEKVFENFSIENPTPQSFIVDASRGEHLFAVRYWEKSFRGIITLAWRPPNGKTAVIPLRVLSPLSAPDAVRLRGSLPRPNAGG